MKELLTPSEESFSTKLRGLYVVTDASATGGHIAMARAALQGGAKIVQLRDKSADSRALLGCAQTLRALTQQHDALLIINDNIELARLCHADGVHLGPDDLPIAQARLALPGFIVGASCGTIEEARQAARDGASYLGVGAVFGSRTKLDAGAPLSLRNLREIIAASRLPVAAIGGISQSNIAQVVRCGAAMACVVSAISKHRDEEKMQAATRELLQAACFSNIEYSI